jgi:hypothetical protein
MSENNVLQIVTDDDELKQRQRFRHTDTQHEVISVLLRYLLQDKTKIKG